MDDDLRALDAWWRAANYLAVGQIYLLDNPLLAEPLAPQHVKPRLLGHWGTTPGLSFLYAHLNRVIRLRDLNILFIAGPGHGGPALTANTWLEGSYSALYPDVTQDAAGMRRLFRQFSFPGGIGSHATPEVPGSIHEGGELGYALAHAHGAAFDNPELVVAYGYPMLIHRLTYRRTNHGNLHVRGYKKEGTTTTPFDMVVRNDIDRFRLVMDTARYVLQLAARAPELKERMEAKRDEHRRYILEHGEDMPEGSA